MHAKLFVPGLFLCIWMGVCLRLLGAGQAFDRLPDADRKVFAQRFEQELWPLLERAGKDGCVGCHGPKHQTTLRFSGKAARDFQTLLKEGFFLPDDPGNLLARVASKKNKDRMPPGNRPRWTEEEIQSLREFIVDLDKKQQR